MESLNAKLVPQAHHLACGSSLSQAPLLLANSSTEVQSQNGSARSTPVNSATSATNFNNSSPGKLLFSQRTASSTPVATIKSQAASIFFPPGVTMNHHHHHHKPPPLPPLTNKGAPYSPALPLRSPAMLSGSRQPDANMNLEQEFNREAHKRISPSSVSAAGQLPSLSFANAFTSPTTNIAANNWTAQLQQEQKEENYHLYHEPIDPDELPSPPPPRPISSSSFAGRAASMSQRVSDATNATNNNHHPDDVSPEVYTFYVSLKDQHLNHRSRSYHGPKNSNEASGSLSGILNSNTNHNHVINRSSHHLGMDKTNNKTHHFGSTSVAELPIQSPQTPLSAMNFSPVHFRDHCVRELLETESNYVHALDMIITCFAKPMEGYLRREDNQLIFGHIKYFHQVHSAFQADLVKAAFRSFSKDVGNLPMPPTADIASRSNPTTPTQFLGNLNSPLPSPSAQSITLSACFLHAKDKFLKYGEYCATLSRAQELLDELTNKNEAIAAQLDHCQQEANEGKFKLRDLLSLPMQRILKYHLLLAQLIKNTSHTSDDYHGLKRAHETMVDLGQYINEVKRDTEAIQIIDEIEQSITGLNMPVNTQLTDYGRLVTDGKLRVKVPSDCEAKSRPLHDTKSKQKRYVFVFDKVMLMCKLSKVRGYEYKEAIVLSEYELDINPAPNHTENGARHSTKDKWVYQFNLVKLSDRSTYCLFAEAPDMRNKWITSIQKAMDNARPLVCRNNETNHEFLMHTFDKASSCDHCGKLLLGLYYQGYRCRTCFISVHKKCLAAARPCGPLLPLKPSSYNNQNKLPSSPSVRSNCSDDSRNNMFSHFPNVNSSSTPCVDVVSKNEYSNIRGRAGEKPAITSSFREDGNRGMMLNQRPVCSMVNVSANSGNHRADFNFLLDGYPWFCGPMERDQAQSYLEEMPHGTFLVRVSPKHNGSYVISLNHNNQVKHMRIYVSKDKQLYLSQNRYFKSVTELVSWYERNSLVESFHMLDAKLSIPFKPK